MPTVLLQHPRPSLQFIGSQKLPPPKTNKKEKLARHGSMLALAAFATHNDVDGCPSLRLAMLCYVSCALPCALCPVLCRVSWVLGPVPRHVASRRQTTPFFHRIVLLKFELSDMLFIVEGC